MRNPLRLLILILLTAAVSGCSGRDWKSKYYMLKAENALSEAAVLKEKKVEYAKRVPIYGKACIFFRKSYDTDNRVFTLNRIEEASDACWRSGNAENEEVFKNFEEEYAKKHPQEYEHGDSGVAMMDMGS